MSVSISKVNSLPTNVASLSPGSRCILPNGKEYILNNSKQWIPLHMLALEMKADLTTENLNSVTSYGIYLQNQNVNATVERNYPSPGSAGILKVFTNGNAVYQEFQVLSGQVNENKTYTRGLYGGVWSSWLVPNFVNFTQAEWNTVNTNSHTHSNKANLDSINQDLNRSSSVIFDKLFVNNSLIFGANAFKFYNSAYNSADPLTIGNAFSGNLPQVVFTGGLVASDNYAYDGQYLPLNGIYSKGVIKTENNLSSEEWKQAYNWGNHATAGYLNLTQADAKYVKLNSFGDFQYLDTTGLTLIDTVNENTTYYASGITHAIVAPNQLTLSNLGLYSELKTGVNDLIWFGHKKLGDDISFKFITYNLSLDKYTIGVDKPVYFEPLNLGTSGATKTLTLDSAGKLGYINGIPALINDVNVKLDKGTYTGNAQDLKNDIDGIQIGGRNLIIQSRLQPGYLDSGTGFPTVVGPDHHDPNYYDCNSGEIFTYTTYDVYTSGYGGGGYMCFYDLNKTFIASYVLSVNGVKGSKTIVTPQNARYYRVASIGKGIKEKLEKGNKATDWTPAPEDKQDRLQNITGNVGVGKTDVSATEKLDVNGNVKASSFIKSGGTSTQFLMADGSVDTYGTTEGTVAEGNHTHTFASITSKPTTLSEYGITDGIKLDDTIQNTNPFGGRKLYINTIDNVLAGANKKYWVTVTKHKKIYNSVNYPKAINPSDITLPQWEDSPVIATYDGAQLFNNNYEDYITCESDEYLKVALDFSADKTAYFNGYPYGTYYLSYYHVNTPDKAEVRCYNGFSAHTVGYKTGTFTDFINSNGSGAYIQQYGDGGNYQRRNIEFIIYGHPAHPTSLTQIEWKLLRPEFNQHSPFVSNFTTNKLYQTLKLGDQTTDKVIINPNGTIIADFVGIGTTSPVEKLDVNGNVKISQSLIGGERAPDGTSYSEYGITGGMGTFGGLYFHSISDTDDDAFGTVGISLNPEEGVSLYSISLGGSQRSNIFFDNTGMAMESGGDFNFLTKSSSKYQTSLIIKNTGNVGIGKLTPSEKLEVDGYVKATGFKTTSGTSTQFLKADGSVDNNSRTFNWENALAVGFSNGEVPTNSGSQYPYIYHNAGGGYVALATHNYVINNFISINHPIYNITQANINDWLSYRVYSDKRQIQPSHLSVKTLQFGFTSWDNNNSAPFGDYLHFGGYQDYSGGNQNLIIFKKNGFGLRQFQGSSQGVSAYSSFVDYWHSGNFNPNDYAAKNTPVFNNKIVIRDNSIEEIATNDTSDVAINFSGYNLGNLHYRNLVIYDGKYNIVATFNGQNKSLNLVGTLTANSLIKSGGTSTQILMADGSVVEKSTIASQTLSTSIDNNGRYLSISGGNQISIDSRLIHVLDSPNRSPNDPIFYPNVTGKSVRFDFISAGHVSGTGNYAGVMTFSPWEGTTASTGDSSYQLAFYNQTGINGSGIPGLKIRKGIDTTWNSWYKIYTDGDFSQSHINNWITAHGWGNHASAGYALATGGNATNNWSNTSSGLSINPTVTGKTLNASGQTVYLRDATYGQISGIVQDSTTGPIVNDWYNKLKTLHNNSAGYFTELAQSFTGTEGVWHRRNSAGTISTWKQLYDDSIWNAASLSYSGSTLTLTINGISKTATINAGSAYTAGTNIAISSNQISVVASPTFGGTVTASGFYESSLRRLKENILPFELSGLGLLSQLEIVTYDRIDKSSINKIGIIADDSPKEFLSENKKAVDLYKTVFIQAKAIQELKSEVDELKEELNNLRDLIMLNLNQF